MILKNGKIFTNTDAGIIDNGWIKIDDGIIEEIGEGEHPFDDTVIDLQGKLVLSGFVNAHTHMYSTLARGIPLSIYPVSFRAILEDLWWKLDKNLTKDAVYYSALIGGIESLKNGITTVIDHHASYGYIRGSLSLVKEALVDLLKMRVDLCYEISDRWGEKKSKISQEESFDFLKEVKKQKNPLLSAHIGLHASFTLEDSTLENVVKNTPDDIGFHIHTAEGPEDQVDAIKNYAKRVIERLDDFGILKRETILVHGVYLSEREKKILKDREVFFAHAPQSNMNNAVGVADIVGLLNDNVDVVLGNDGFGFNILNDLRVMMILQKYEKRDFNGFGFDNLYKIFLNNNYKLSETFFPGKFGKIKQGYNADLVVLDYVSPTPLDKDNLLGHIIFGLSDRINVDKVFINGEMRVNNGKMVGICEEDVYKEAQKVASSLWNKMI